MKQTVLGTIIAMMFLGLVANALGSWKELGIIGQRVVEVESKIKTQHNVDNDLAEKIYDLHWYIIESKGVKIKRGNR